MQNHQIMCIPKNQQTASMLAPPSLYVEFFLYYPVAQCCSIPYVALYAQCSTFFLCGPVFDQSAPFADWPCTRSSLDPRTASTLSLSNKGSHAMGPMAPCLGSKGSEGSVKAVSHPLALQQRLSVAPSTTMVHVVFWLGLSFQKRA